MYTFNIKHGSKQGNKSKTSFSYTRCSLQSRMRTLRRTTPSRTQVIGLIGSDHSASLKKLDLLLLDLFPYLGLCLILIVYMKSRPPRSVFNFSSLLLSFLLRVAMFVGSHS